MSALFESDNRDDFNEKVCEILQEECGHLSQADGELIIGRIRSRWAKAMVRMYAKEADQ
jgi:hypothetical protein